MVSAEEAYSSGDPGASIVEAFKLRIVSILRLLLLVLDLLKRLPAWKIKRWIRCNGEGIHRVPKGRCNRDSEYLVPHRDVTTEEF